MVALVQMLFRVSTVAFCVMFDFADGSIPDRELEMIFRGRTKSQWEEAWHRERYIRCRESLMSHLYWACEKDIYRITRRSQQGDNEILPSENYALNYPWVPRQRAKRYLRNKRGYSLRSGSSITSECCRSSGCTWEEYAEYCPTNKRYV